MAKTIAAQVTGKGEVGSFDGHGECFVEVGGGKAGFGRGNFYAEPRPMIKFRKPTRYWHAAKVLFVLAWNLVGDALRDILDPRIRNA